MSFYSGSKNSFCPGPITGNPMSGLCEKACIHAKKVFDACMRQIQESDVQVTINEVDPSFVQPLTYVSVKCISSEVELNNLVIERFDDKPCFARVSGTVVVPIEVSFVDANGAEGVGTSEIAINSDVVLYVPQQSVVPFTVEAFASCITPDGEYLGNNIFSFDTCITIILRVVVEAEMLVPTYGYCPIPPCQEYTQDVCSGFFELPLYPVQQPVCNAT